MIISAFIEKVFELFINKLLNVYKNYQTIWM